MASRKRAASDTCVIETRRRRIEHSTHHAVPQNCPLGAYGRLIVKGVPFVALDDPFLHHSTDIARSDLAPNAKYAREYIVPLLLR